MCRQYRLPIACLQRWLALLATLQCIAQPCAAQADRASEEAVKAGFIYNFAKFTEWPSSRGQGSAKPLQICVLGTDPLNGWLAQLQERTILYRKVVVQTNVRSDSLQQCHILFIAAADDSRVEAALHALANAPVLTIGDMPGFVQAGGMIGLRAADNRVRFEINLAAAQRAGLKMSSQMLKLASQVLQ
jgi:hypothetical protein